MINYIIKGDYANHQISIENAGNIGKEKLCVLIARKKKLYLTNENVVYCNIVDVEAKNKFIASMINAETWRHISGDIGTLYGLVTAPKKYTYYIEFELADGKHLLTKVSELTKQFIKGKFTVSTFALGRAITKYDFYSHIMTEEERAVNGQNNKGCLKYLAIYLIVCVCVLSFILICIYQFEFK